MNYIKSIIDKTDYQKVQPKFGKFLCELCPVEIEEGKYAVLQALVSDNPTDAEFEYMEKDAEAYYLPVEKNGKIAAITTYDKSPAVNSFSLGGNPMWLPLEERKSMRQSLIALKAEGIETFTYWLGLTPITMPVAQFETIMDKVEVYALQCFNVTAQHKAEVMALTTLAEVAQYDITAGYPEKLAF